MSERGLVNSCAFGQAGGQRRVPGKSRNVARVIRYPLAVSGRHLATTGHLSVRAVNFILRFYDATDWLRLGARQSVRPRPARATSTTRKARQEQIVPVAAVPTE